MARLIRLTAALVVLLPGLMLSKPVGASMSAARNDLLLLRAGSGAGTTLIAQSMSSGRQVIPLPSGLVDRASHTLYVAGPDMGGTTGGARSLLRAIDIVSGRSLRSLVVPGRYSTQTADYSGATLSFNGRWLALRAMSQDTTSTTAIVVDTTAMRMVATLHLAGHFGLDALDSQGKVLYLIESRPGHGPDAYRVRSYEIHTGTLDPGPVLEKGETEGAMNGVAWTRVWSSNGEWLFTLYVHPGHAGAFVHALGVEYRLAQCIDLPATKAAPATLAHYALAVSPDGQNLFAVNPLLGQVEAMRGNLPYGTPEVANLERRDASPQHMLNGTAISSDGGALFVATNHGVWVLNAYALSVSAVYLRGQEISSVALSQDGRRLYALNPDRRMIETLDPANGTILGRIATQAGAWALEEVFSGV